MQENLIKILILNSNFNIFGKFWQVINGYHSGETYQEIMKKFFNAKTEIRRHRITFKKRIIK